MLIEETDFYGCKTILVLFFVLIDEAHTLEPTVARKLLNLSQALHASGSAFMLTLAGTPGLERTLKRARATFWERCETLGIGLLGQEAVIRAVVEPFESRGIEFEKAVASRVPDVTQNYAYFAALYGSALWMALASESGGAVSANTAKAATIGYERQVRVFYSRRYGELEDEGLLDAARAVAGRFARQLRWDRKGLCEAMERAVGGSNPAAAFERLRDLGFIWRAPGETAHEAGIPSLMDFVARRHHG